jgi:radical SAM protein with 4Fe4S-binding SPASM domain
MKKAQQPISSVKKYPAMLQSRDGWTNYLEMLRTDEPHLHQIEPTNHCPYTCVMCPRTDKMTRELGYMDMDLYKKVIDEVDTYKEPVRSKEIELFHFGESLLHPQIDEMIAYASGKGLNIVLSVNSPQLKPDLTDRILEANPYKIIISMDGYDDESYKKIRGKAANYQKALKHIEYLLEARKKIPNTSEIIIRMIKFEVNEDHTESFREEWEKKGVKVEIRTFFPWSEKEMVEMGEYEKNPPFMPCSFPFRYVVVQWNGDVVPCCRDYNAVNQMGNVNDSSLKEIWNSPDYQKLRQQLRTGDYGDNDYCRECMSIYYTEE